MAEALAKYFRVETNSTILPYIVRDHAWNMDMHDMSGSFFKYRDDAPDGYHEFMDYECPHPTNYPIGDVECGEEHDPINDAPEVCETDDEECEAEAAEEEECEEEECEAGAEEEEEEITYPFSPSCSEEQHSFRGGRRLQPGDPDADAGGGGDSGAYGDLDEATQLRVKCDDFDQYKETVPTSRQMPYSPCRLCNAFAVSAAAPVRRAPYTSPPPPRSG